MLATYTRDKSWKNPFSDKSLQRMSIADRGPGLVGTSFMKFKSTSSPDSSVTNVVRIQDVGRFDLIVLNPALEQNARWNGEQAHDGTGTRYP